MDDSSNQFKDSFPTRPSTENVRKSYYSRTRHEASLNVSKATKSPFDPFFNKKSSASSNIEVREETGVNTRPRSTPYKSNEGVKIR